VGECSRDRQKPSHLANKYVYARRKREVAVSSPSQSQISLVSSSVTQTAKTKANKLKGNAEYRAHRRANDEAFAESERASRKRHTDFNRWARAFARAHPTEFHQFLRAKGADSQVLRSALGLTPHMPATTPAIMPAQSVSPNGNGGPKAPAAVDLIALLGLARD